MKLKFGTFLLLCLFLLNGKAVTKSDDFILGQIENIHSEILEENRILNIYLPDGYNKETAYPVIYLLDGSADEDFIHIAGLVQYNAFPWVNRVAPSILVGVANSNRKKDFTSPSTNKLDMEFIPNNGGSTKFISFIEKELQPYIETKFKTTDSKTIIGQSLGGLLASEILFTKPQLFDKYIIISPSLWWRDNYLMNETPAILNGSYTKPISIYIGVGTEGSIDDSSKAMEDDAKLLADKIAQAKAKNITIFFDHMKDEDHGTAGHQAVMNAFKLFMKVTPIVTETILRTSSQKRAGSHKSALFI